jgi:hypothetical protein
MPECMGSALCQKATSNQVVGVQIRSLLELMSDCLHSFGLPQSPNLYTSWEDVSTERRLTDFAVKVIQQCWEKYRTDAEYYARPEFQLGEQVWTCRRICSLYVSERSSL